VQLVRQRQEAAEWQAVAGCRRLGGQTEQVFEQVRHTIAGWRSRVTADESVGQFGAGEVRLLPELIASQVRLHFQFIPDGSGVRADGERAVAGVAGHGQRGQTLAARVE